MFLNNPEEIVHSLFIIVEFAIKTSFGFKRFYFYIFYDVLIAKLLYLPGTSGNFSTLLPICYHFGVLPVMESFLNSSPKYFQRLVVVLNIHKIYLSARHYFSKIKVLWIFVVKMSYSLSPIFRNKLKHLK